ncbi:hypothetical protein GQX73_g6502 [Xylaria multiplex]|uniref:C2H2-type domain-containing protein n=1 Tax=Xylaria multiplex TaxID=323545 RepID=A0A7C8IV14_9PEZI|nr:hypothetical protein GQX73_g6502 [Xylaria multiplex]
MEAAAATAIRTSSNMSGESPVATNRDASQTPGRDPMQYQPAEIITNGVHVNGADNIGRTSPPTAVPMPPLIQPPSASPLSSQLPPSGQTPSAPVSSSQPLKHPPSKQSPSIQLPCLTTGSPTASTLQRAPIFYSPSFKYTAVITAWASPPTISFKRDLSILADAVQQSCPEAVRRIVRDKWEKCITGSEFHHAFLMNAIIHHASGIIMRRAIHDFGQTMVSEAKQEIASCLSSQDLDDIAPTIFEKCSDKFLDMALEQRLKTIDARSLINALARAERLGYESGDILEDRPERVVLATQSPRATQANLSINTQSRPPPAAPAEASLLFQTQPAQHTPATGDLTCRLCWRGFQNTKTYEYHVQKQLCKKADSDQYHYWCEDCGSGFTTKSSQQYHRSNAVCGAHTTAAATPQRIPGSGMFPSTKPLKYAHYVPHTPTLPDPIPIQTPSPSQGDPYRHLTPQRRAELDDELRQLELSYVPRFKEAEEMADLMARRAKLDSLHNTFSTRQSSIRKKYGVRLRVRRTRAEINEERSRMGLKHSTSATAETPSAKRQRSDDGSNNLGQSYVSRSPQARTPNPPTNHLPVSQMNNSGLGGSIATAATTDPTVSVAPNQLSSTDEQPPPNTLSSLQRKGYRVSSHVGQATQPDSCSTIQRTGSSSTPVVLDDSSDGTDTDEDIPSTLPPKKNL